MQSLINLWMQLRYSFALSLASIALAGCGAAGDGKNRVALEGEIKLNGKALPSGLVSFLPIDEKGETAVAKIENGKYAIDRANGPTIGTYKVLINSTQPTGRKIRDSDNPAQLVSEEREVVPRQYNSDSALTIEIKAGGKQNFELQGGSSSKIALNSSRRK